MGMYTEIIFGCKLKKDTPEIAVNALRWMCGEIEKPASLPNHEFFADEKNRWLLFRTGSSYFGVGVAKMWNDKITSLWHISARGNIKNYNGEIEKFLDWVKQYVDSGSGARGFYAVVCYEEQSEPTIYYLYDD